jgi:hypothetical protein
MNTPNVFLHDNNIFSAPFCHIGQQLVYMWFNNRPPNFPEGTVCCNSMFCTCSADYPIKRKGTPQEKENFYQSLSILADERLYEAAHNL